MLSPVSSLSGSIRIVLVDAYGDGTVWFAFEDSNGRRARACIDGRARSHTRNRLFDGVSHPNDSNATLLELGGSEESIVVPLVSQWLDSGPPQTLGLTEYGWEQIRDALVRLGDPGV